MTLLGLSWPSPITVRREPETGRDRLGEDLAIALILARREGEKKVSGER